VGGDEAILPLALLAGAVRDDLAVGDQEATRGLAAIRYRSFVPAGANRVSGKVRQSTSAVLRLMASSNFVGSEPGNSGRFAHKLSARLL
jgi:hypothetical protein